MAALNAAGASVLHRPALRIQPLNPPAPVLSGPIHWLVLTSPNAVIHGSRWLDHYALTPQRIAAVGPGTALAAEQRGLVVDVAPSVRGGADDLLAVPDFSPTAGERVLIVRGRGGRRQLQTALSKRGITVVEMAVYERLAAAEKLDIPRPWQERPLAFTVVTSGDGLQHLLGMADAVTLKWLYQSQLVTVSERVAKAALAAGFNQPVIADGASDQAIVNAIAHTLE
jgi:uroporphyrinogen-III synthase